MAIKVLAVDDSKTIRMIVKKAFNPFDCCCFCNFANSSDERFGEGKRIRNNESNWHQAQ